MQTAAVRIGLISDTHGLLRDEAIDALRGSELILHAGDVGGAGILEMLRQIAPIVAVRGNVDVGPWAKSLPETEVVETELATFYVLHNLHELDLKAHVAGFQIVVSGHSHKPKQRELDGVLYLNPGSAGPRRFHLPITIGRLDLAKKPWKMELIDVSGGG